MGSNQFYYKSKCFEPIYRLPKGVGDLFTLKNAEFFDPGKGLEGYLCPGTKQFIMDAYLQNVCVWSLQVRGYDNSVQ